MRTRELRLVHLVKPVLFVLVICLDTLVPGGDVLPDGLDPREPVSEVGRNAVKKAGAKEGDLGQQT